jgi:hypothetical protein
MLFVKMILNFFIVMGYCSVYVNIFKQGFKCNIDDNASKAFSFQMQTLFVSDCKQDLYSIYILRYAH